MKKSKHSKLFLDALRTVPVVQVACEKSGVSRNTVYRWRRDDINFAIEFDEAMNDGVAFVNDMSESQLLQLIKDRSFSAVRYWLSHNHSRFKKEVIERTKVQSDEESEEYKQRMIKLREQVTRMNNEWFETNDSD